MKKEKSKFLKVESAVATFRDKHPKLIRELETLRDKYIAALEEYKDALRKHLTENELASFVDPETGVRVTYKKPETIIRAEELIDRYGWVTLSKYFDKRVTYVLKDDSALHRMVADGVLTLEDLHPYVVEKPRKPAVTVPPAKKDVLAPANSKRK